ncbi:pyridoxal phosphate-dependent aminotransferase [Jeotgalibacillus sp. ET6]|uniref:MalY/PatB family protein n=1 Tax=Jeotgalibacillus sp. ET6 TaxID=3037260 RepID=UPI0024184ED3|nr:MalY/PatB family protein [Jeotgalibacillus sp. ET6]MDG5471814.1 pyridoxal phosphate-dependent aminotransferase [Jeotgalibacillus sp. ET6]
MELFDQPIDRAGTSSVKWDMLKTVFGSEDLLPMWVADMDFKPPQAVLDRLETRLNLPPYGYTFVPDSTGKAVAGWMERKHGWTVKPNWIMYSNGVVPSISTAIRALSKPGDQVLTLTPVYTPFFQMIELNERKLAVSLLLEEEGRYEINWTDFEQKISHSTLFLLCSPHNPSGRVWSRHELERISELCRKHQVTLISDEIHSDLLYSHAEHVPAALAAKDQADHIVTLAAPSKTFNLAGLQASVIIAKNEELREKIQAEQTKQGFFTLNTFGISAMEAAYEEGEEWLQSLMVYLEENLKLVREAVSQIPGVTLMEPDSTYLLWMDFRDSGKSDEEVQEALLKKAKLALEPGEKYGEGGQGHVRMNIACSRDLVKEGIKRLKIAFE